MASELWTTVSVLIAAGFGGGGVGSLITAVISRRKVVADADFATAEAARSLSTTATSLVAALLGPAQEEILKLRTELAATRSELATVNSELLTLRRLLAQTSAEHGHPSG